MNEISTQEIYSSAFHNTEENGNVADFKLLMD